MRGCLIINEVMSFGWITSNFYMLNGQEKSIFVTCLLSTKWLFEITIDQSQLTISNYDIFSFVGLVSMEICLLLHSVLLHVLNNGLKDLKDINKQVENN